MSRSRTLRPFAPLLLLLAGTGAFAQSQPPAADAPEPARPARAERGLPDSVRRVERETGGEVLRAEPMQRDGREVYRIKVLTADGRVRVMQDDPNARRDDGSQDKRNSREKRPSRDPDGEPPQF